MTWEQDFDSDREYYKDDAGKVLGAINPEGASWCVMVKGDTEWEVIAFRPDQKTAQKTLVRYLTAAEKEKAK